MTALRAGAPLLPVGCYFMDHGDSRADIRRPLDTSARHGAGRLRDDLGRVTQDLARRLRGAHPGRTHPLAPAPAQLAQRSARVG